MDGIDFLTLSSCQTDPIFAFRTEQSSSVKRRRVFLERKSGTVERQNQRVFLALEHSGMSVR